MGANDMQMMMAMMGGGGFGGPMGDMAQMSQMQRSLPRIDPTRYAEGYEIRRSLRGAFNGPGVRPTGRIGGGGTFSGRPGFEPMPQMGGGMDPTSVTDPNVANSALALYGLQLPTHTNPFLFFNDQHQDGSPTWAGNHPRAAKAVEGALVGLTTEGGNTAGESMSNIARTVLGIPAMYRQSQAAQQLAPFGMAEQIAGLQAVQGRQNLEAAQAFHLYATGRAALEKPPNTKATIPMTTTDGKVFGYDPNDNSMSPTTGAPEGGIFKVGTPGKPSGTFPKGISTRPERLAWTQWMKDPTYQEGQFPLDWDTRVTKAVARDAGASGAASAGGRKGVDLGMGGVTEEDKLRIQNLRDAVNKAESEAKPSSLNPMEYMGRPEGVTKAMQNELATRKKTLQSAKDAYNNAVGGLNNSNNKTSSTPAPTNRRTIDLTK